MANAAAKSGAAGGKSRPGSRMVEEFKPSSGWVEDQNCHYLLVDLPEFKKEEVKIQTDSVEQITISGERQVRENKYIYFERTFKVPENSDIQKTSGRLEDGILTVTLPKRVTEAEAEGKETAHHEQDSDNESRHDGEKHYEQPEKEGRARKSWTECCYSDEIIQKWGEDRSILRSTMKMLNKNKGILITAILAFSLGVFMRRKFESSGCNTTLLP